MDNNSHLVNRNAGAYVSLSVNKKGISLGSTISPDTKVTQNIRLAIPQLVRRKSGRYTVRIRLIGETVPFLSLSTRTTSRSASIMRQKELSAAAKSFLLDNPETTASELREHLISIAVWLLTEPTDDYWNGIDIAWLEDAKVDLRQIAARERLSTEQQEYIADAIKVLTAGQQRVDYGDTEGLREFINSNNHIKESTIGDATPILKVEQHDCLGAFQGEQPEDVQKATTFNELVASLLIEKQKTIKESSYRDLVSSLRTVTKFVPEGMDIMNRSKWLEIRDSMLTEGLSPATVNKLLIKTKMTIDYGLMNKQLPEGRNPIERMKLTKNIESKRRAFTDAELQAVTTTLESISEEPKRWAGMLSIVTGARAAEIAQLTTDDIVTLDCGTVCIDINERNGKSAKNKHSVRLVPLINGVMGFDLESFLKWVNKVKEDNLKSSNPAPLFGMTPSTYSVWFNSAIVRKTLNDTNGISLHSLRHWLASRLKARGVSLVDTQGILGHSSQSLAFDLYGKGHSLERLKDALVIGLKN